MGDGPRKFRKKPVVIEAIQYRGQYTDEIKEFLGDWPHVFDNTVGIKLATLENDLSEPLTVSLYDWIIRGVQREFYPCKPDIFEQTYEPV